MEAVDVTTGVCVVVNTLPDRVTVMMGQLDVLDLRFVARPTPSPTPSATARHKVAITVSAPKYLLRLVLETGRKGGSGWLNAILLVSLEPV